jgi:hypothetical protein
MAKHILFNAVTNVLSARYDSEIHGENIPEEAVEVEDELFFRTINESDGIWTLTESGIVKADFPPEDPAVVIENMWTRIKAKRDQVKNGGVLVGDNWFHSDDPSRIQQLGLKDRARDALAAEADPADPLVIDGANVLWKTMGGAFVPMTPELIFLIVDAIGILDKRAFMAAEVHRATMAAQPDPAIYDFSGNWPDSYQA